MTMGLFALGVWLHPSETQVFLDALDTDGGGKSTALGLFS